MHSKKDFLWRGKVFSAYLLGNGCFLFFFFAFFTEKRSFRFLCREKGFSRFLRGRKVFSRFLRWKMVSSAFFKEKDFFVTFLHKEKVCPWECFSCFLRRKKMFCFFSLSTQRKVYILFSAQGKIFPGFCAEKVFSSSLSAQRKAFSPQWECFFLLSVQIKCISFCFLWREFFFFVSFSTQRKCFPCFLKSKRFSISTQRNASIFFSVLHRQKLFFLSYRTEKGFPRFLCRERFFSWVLHNEKFFFFFALWESFFLFSA